MKRRKIFILPIQLALTLVLGWSQLFSQPVFRWDVKTLTDDSGVDWMAKLESAKQASYASIEGLTTKPIRYNSCHDVGLNSRRYDEKRVVKLKVRLVNVKRESNDEDYHIVLQSLTDSNNYMVAEVPDPATPRLQEDEYEDMRTLYTGLREEINLLLGANITLAAKKFPPNTIVKIFGVPFYDCKHPGAVHGASKNFRELHPVLDVQKIETN